MDTKSPSIQIVTSLTFRHPIRIDYLPYGPPGSEELGAKRGSQMPLNQVVGPDGTTTTVASSPTPSAYGQTVTFTATVTTGGPGTFDNRGTVQFLVDGTDYGHRCR